MLVIVATPVRLESTLVAGSQRVHAAAARWPEPRPPAADRGPASRSPFWSARSARSALTTVAESGRVVWLLSVWRGQSRRRARRRRRPRRRRPLRQPRHRAPSSRPARCRWRCRAARSAPTRSAASGPATMTRSGSSPPPPARLAITMTTANAAMLSTRLIAVRPLPASPHASPVRRRAASVARARADQAVSHGHHLLIPSTGRPTVARNTSARLRRSKPNRLIGPARAGRIERGLGPVGRSAGIRRRAAGAPARR